MLYRILLLFLLLLQFFFAFGNEATDAGVDDVYFEDVLTSSSEKLQLFSQLLLPFRVNLDEESDRKMLLNIVRFIDSSIAQCPLLDTWEMLCVVFQLLSLEQIYGQQRLSALRQLTTTSFDNVIGSHSGYVDGNIGDFRVRKLWDIELRLSSDQVFSVPLGNIALKRGFGNQTIIQLDLSQQILRPFLLAKQRQRESYAKKVVENDAILQKLHYADITKDQQRRRQKLNEQRKQLEMVREFDSFWRKHKEKGERRAFSAPFITEQSTEAEVTSKRYNSRCENIRHAIQTLESNSVLSSERRMLYLRKMEKKVCGATLINVDYRSMETCDSRCFSYCEGVAVLQEWSAQSGSAVSTVQVHALYHNILLAAFSGFDGNAEDYILQLRKLVTDDVERGVFSTCEDLCKKPSASLLSEIKFFAGVLELLNDIGPMSGKGNEDEMSVVWWSRAGRAHLRIWEAARAGSRRAAAALATMKEHGMLSPRQGQVAVALLSKILSEKHVHFWRQVMEGGEMRRLGEPVLSAQKLLRHERFFGIKNSWNVVNEPHITRERIIAISTEIVGSSDGETEASSTFGEVPTAVLGSLFMARMYVAGIKGVTRDLKRAECLLLHILRQLRYTCDVTHPEEFDEEEFSRNGRGGSCREHLDSLIFLRQNSMAMGPCWELHDRRGLGENHLGLRFALYSKKAYEVVYDVLVLLAYVHLLNGLQHDLAAKYAFLALELGAAAFHTARVSMPDEAEDIYLRASSDAKVNFTTFKDKSWLVKELFVHAVKRGKPNDRLFDFTRSGFLSYDNLVILAVTLLYSNSDTEQLICGAAEHYFGSLRCVEKVGGASCRAQWVFFFLLEAARLWRDDATTAGVLSFSYTSQHLADAFMIMAMLLKNGNITITDIHEGQLFVSPLYGSGSLNPFWPSGSDTCTSYIGKLRRFARKVSPYSLPGRRTAVYTKNWNHFLYSSGAFLRKLRFFRTAVRAFLEEHDMNPLLVVSDMHTYLDKTSSSPLKRIYDTIWNAILYLFTQTQEEALAQQFAKTIFSGNVPDEVPVIMAERLAFSVVSSSFVREVSIALQLISAALVSGEPDGFTLILIEEMDRGNRHLSGVADLISEHLFKYSLVEVLMEEHKSAQWNLMRPQTRGIGAIFTINSQIPFSYALLDSKLEFFAQVALRHANVIEQRQRAASIVEGSSANRNSTLLSSFHKEIIHNLALCSGVLIDVAIHKGLTLPPQKPYYGMYFPVGNLLCLRKLLQYVQSTGVSPFAALSPAAAELWILETISDFAAVQARYYDISFDVFSELFGGSVDATEGKVSLNKKEKKRLRKLRKFLVEPWNCVDDENFEELPPPGLGEGAYYNSRLHRLTGTYYAAQLQILYTKAKLWLQRLMGGVW